MSAPKIFVGDIMSSRGGTLNPALYPHECFESYSIPAFDASRPDLVLGSHIGSTKQLVKPGDVLLSKIVPHIRRAWVVPEAHGKRQIASSEWIVFRSNRTHPAYLRHMLVSNSFHAQFMNTVAGVGGSLLRARPAFVSKIQIPLPPMGEQQRIAHVLDRADALRAKRRETLALLDGLTQAIFLDMFGDPVVNPRSWPLVALGSLMETRGAKVNPTGFLNEPFDLLSIPAYDTGHPTIAHGSEIGSMKQIVQPNDVLLSKIVPHIRRAWIVPQPCGRRQIASSEWIVFRDGAVEPLFLQALLVNDSFHRNFMSTVAGVGGSLLRARPAFVAQLLVPMPPLGLQRQFAQWLRTVAEAHAVAGQHSAGLDNLFASLQQGAFAGVL